MTTEKTTMSADPSSEKIDSIDIELPDGSFVLIACVTVGNGFGVVHVGRDGSTSELRMWNRYRDTVAHLEQRLEQRYRSPLYRDILRKVHADLVVARLDRRDRQLLAGLAAKGGKPS